MNAVKKYFRLLLIGICTLNYFSISSQGKIALGIYQDVKLLFLGDSHLNPSGTIDIMFNLKIQGNQNTYGYFIITPEYEQANLSEIFKRLSVNLGFVFNQLYIRNLHFIRNIELTTNIGYGIIYRHQRNSRNWSFNAIISYKLNDFLKVSLKNQFLNRGDLMLKYKVNESRYSLFFGLEFSLFKISNSRPEYCF